VVDWQQDGQLVIAARERWNRNDAMLDGLFVLITVVFFAVATAYVVACERLR
jgi:hypothetical protein